jgi:ligand-binding sensor domain-containing protein/HPt (histidine-containing phosphotransfer) domain-containing protein
MQKLILSERLPLSRCIACKILVLFVLLIPFCIVKISSASSIPEKISFQNILENKDIALGEVNAIFQDSEGFMWLGGANALIRYDGYEFRQIYISSDDSSDDSSGEKESMHFAENIFEDSHHNMWVASRAGLLKYDSSKERLTRIKDDDNNPMKISTCDIVDVKELSTGEILVGSAIGLFIVDPVTFKYTSIAPDPQKQNWLHSPRVNSIYLDGPDDIWLGTNAGLEKLNWKTKTFTLYKLTENHDLMPDNRVADIVADGEGKFWVATYNGVVHYDPKTQQTKRYVHDRNDRFSIGSNDVMRLLMDSQGTLWTASDGGGLSVFDKEKNRFINHKFDAGRAGSLSTDKARTVFEDKNGDIWVGNYPIGINFFDRSSAPIATYTNDKTDPTSVSHSMIQHMTEDKDGNLWIGTDGGGLNFFDREKNEFTSYKHDPEDPNTIGANAVLATFIDSTGLVWTGTWAGGLASFNPADKKFTRYPFDKERKTIEKVSTSTKLNSSSIWSIREDKNRDLWISTHSGGISKYNRETKLFTHYAHLDNDPTSISSDIVWSTLEDSRGNFWAGTVDGLNLMDRENATFTNFTHDPKNPRSLSNPSILSILEDSKQRLWLGTNIGLNLYNPETKDFTVYNKKSGFIDDGIRNIVEDLDGNLWVSTNNGFSSFNPETKKIKNYNRIGGRLVGGFLTDSGLLSKRGEVIFGGIEGMRIFHPEELSENKKPPPVVLTDFKIFADSILVDGPDGILTKAINQTDTIVLDYKKSMFVFSFSALNFRDTEKNKYAYKLEGFDNDWLDSGNQRTAKYTNLNAGTYVFKVKGSNNDGVWNEEGKSITIIQLPPPWQTWWAYTLYVFTTLSLLGGFVYSQRRKRQLVEEQNKILEIKVREQTAEVREKSKDIEAMLSNIPQGLFTVQADGTIHPEYSQFLEVIFATAEIAGRKVNEFLFARADIGSDTLDSVRTAIFTIVGEDKINFDFNQYLLPVEYSIDIGHKKKNLSLDWNPIIADNIITKLMVSVRDVTQLRQMEHAAREQKRQLDIVSQLLNLSAEKYLNFEESTTRYLQANRKAIQSCSHHDKNVIALLFRHMHTIKGNCRTFGFTYLSNTVHEVESAYSALKCEENPVSWEPLLLLNDLDLVEKALAEYAHVYRAVLGRSNSASADRCGGLWFNNDAINKIKNYVKNREVNEFETFISRFNAITLEQNLADIIASLSSVAAQLDKRTPVVEISANKIFIKDSAQELIRDIFAHILRNSVDHGLETTEERIAAGKSESGSIVIAAKVKQKTLSISVQDDGRGLNIESLFKKGVELGKWNEHDKPDIIHIAELIFDSGISTKDVVSDISGRGVGLDAVKQFLQEQNGGVSLKLYPEKSVNQRYIPFELVVALPADTFFEAE